MDGRDQLSEFYGQFDWRASLREQRIARRLSQADVAARANLSAASVRAYENGSRHPTVEALDALIKAIGLTPEQANPVRAGAGYSVDLRWLISSRYAPAHLEQLAEQAESYTWPVVVTNVASDLLVMNAAFKASVGPALMKRLSADPELRNYIAVASDPEFVARIDNWDEAVKFMIGVAKGEPREDHNLERPVPFTEGAIARFLKGDPALVRRMMTLWQEADPVAPGTRRHYRWLWRSEDGRPMRFMCVLHVADIWSELTWIDYVPQDAATWDVLTSLPAVRP
jgi:transcriptional regulator with XRE-family HTH domain